MSLTASTGGRRRMSDINVTPMVDVMLVLLVIFMITAPTLKEGFSVEIPQAEATQSVEIQNARIITITAEGDVLHDRAAAREDRYDSLMVLTDDLKAYKADCIREKRDPVVVIVGDRDARYERIIQVWNAVRNAGIPGVSFQVEPGASAVADGGK